MLCNDNVWKKLKISDCAEVVCGGTPSTSKSEYWDGNISWITPKDLSNYNSVYISKGNRNISELGLNNSSAKLLPKNTILLTTRAPIGYIAIAKNELSTNQGFKSLIMKNGNIPEFFYYLLKNNIEIIKNLGNGTTFMEVNSASLKNLELPIPPLEEQKKIASILSSLDDKIELNNRMNKILEETAQTIFKEWFINFNFPNEKGKPYKKSGGKMIESELGEIPESWKVGTIGDIANIVSGKRPPKQSKIKNKECNIPIYGASSIMGYTNSILYNEKILITGRVGTHGIIQRVKIPCWASDNTLIITSNVYEYTYQNLKNVHFHLLNRGSTQPLITQSDLKNIKIIIPNNNLISKFELYARNLFNLHNMNNILNEKLAGIRDSILPKLMSGEIRIK